MVHDQALRQDDPDVRSQAIVVTADETEPRDRGRYQRPERYVDHEHSDVPEHLEQWWRRAMFGRCSRRHEHNQLCFIGWNEAEYRRSYNYGRQQHWLCKSDPQSSAALQCWRWP